VGTTTRWLRGVGAGILALTCDSPTRPLVVHEWGTITTRHAPDGTADGRLNRIDSADVLPPFVHRWEPPATARDSANLVGKSPLVPGRPDVTMRLETPVIYFHPPRNWQGAAFDVDVQFRGGVVNEFYPMGQASLAVDTARVLRKMEAGILAGWDGKVLDNYVLGGLRWGGLTLEESVPLPQTASRVWLAPRAVKSSAVLAGDGSGERYLFYRGVAHLDALFATRTTTRDVVLLTPQRMLWLAGESTVVDRAWLVDVRPDGAVAFRERSALRLDKARGGAEVARIERFGAADHSSDNLPTLRSALKSALEQSGLFADEAEAMLETWQESYFGRPGLRLLYIVPQEWVTYHLPLNIFTPHVLTRVLVGRIDLRD
jgi:hypothetical protein